MLEVLLLQNQKGDSPWTILPPSPLVAMDYYYASTIYDNKYWIYSGYSGYQQLNAFDFITGKWLTGIANGPANRIGGTMSAWNGKLFVYGGASYYNLNKYNGNVYIYDIATNTWSEGTPSLNRGYFMSDYKDNYLYVLGGLDYTNVVNRRTDFSRYDMENNVWETIAANPIGVGVYGAGAIKDNDFFAHPSNDGVGQTGKFFKVALDTGVSTLHSTNPNAMSGSNGVIIDNYFYIAGSGNLDDIITRVSLETGIWEYSNTGVNYGVANIAAWGNKIVFCSGRYVGTRPPEFPVNFLALLDPNKLEFKS